MSDFDISLDGLESIQARLEEIENDVDSDAVYVTGTNVEYGVYLEFGTEDMPPYSWFRPAIREFKANPETFIQNNTDFSSIDEIESTDEMVATIAVALANQMEKNVSANTSTDRSPGTHPEHPQRDTSNLVNDISAQRIK